MITDFFSTPAFANGLFDTPPLGLPMEPWQTAKPRAWQAAALPAALAAIDGGQRGIVSAVMGSGKSIFASEIVRLRPQPKGFVTVISTPTVKLVEQLTATLKGHCAGQSVGMYYTQAKEIRDVIVCCNSSMVALAAELNRRNLKVGLWLADEAHRSQSNEIIEANALLEPQAAIGFSATPFRSKKDEDLSLWNTLVCEYTAAMAFADGVVVPPRLVQWQGQEAPLDQVCVSLIADHVKYGPGLCNALNIDDAEAFATRLTSAHIPSAAIHSRQTRELQAQILADLKAGKLACIVHVNMLAEGVDLPWLRWLCMRRPVGSCVRFCQEVGRVLRASPGKDCAYLLDPHDLFNTFGLTYEAMLAGSADKLENKPEVDELAEELDKEKWDKPELFAKALAAFRKYIRRLYVALFAVGIVQDKIKPNSNLWRADPASDRQKEWAPIMARKLAKDTGIPLIHRKALTIVANNAKHYTKGDAADLLSIVFSLKPKDAPAVAWPDLRETIEISEVV